MSNLNNNHNKFDIQFLSDKNAKHELVKREQIAFC